MTSTPSIKRVLYVVSLFPCWSETFIVREIQALIRDGVDVRIVSLKNASESLVQTDAIALLDRVRYPAHGVVGVMAIFSAAIRNPIGSLHCIYAIVSDMWRTPMVMIKSLGAFARCLQHLHWLNLFDPQIIHAHWATYPSTAAWCLSRIAGRRFSFTCHAHDIFLHRQLLARKLEDADLAITISQFNVDWLSHHISPLAVQKLAVVHCGVDLQHIKFNLDDRVDQLIIAVGRFNPIKGFDVLIDALHQLSDRNIEYQCTIIGDGPLYAELEEKIRSLNIGNRIVLAGALPQESVQAALYDASIFVLPCQVAADGSRDGIPVALMEAMASGCTVVTTAVSGIPELVENDVNGLVVAERDVTGLANALQRLLADTPLRRRLAKAARMRVESEFDAQTEARRLRQLMSEAVNER